MLSFLPEPNIILLFILFVVSVILLVFLYLNLKNHPDSEGSTISSNELPSGGFPVTPPSEDISDIKNRLEEISSRLSSLSESAGTDEPGPAINIPGMDDVNQKIASFIETVREDRAMLVGIVNEKVSKLEIKFDEAVSRIEKAAVRAPAAAASAPVDLTEINGRFDEMQNMLNIIAETQSGDVVKEILEPNLKKIISSLDKLAKK